MVSWTLPALLSTWIDRFQVVIDRRLRAAVAASVAEILEMVADRNSLEQTFKDVKEAWGAGQQQVRNLRAKVLGRWWDRTSALSTRLALRLCFGTVVGPLRPAGGPGLDEDYHALSVFRLAASFGTKSRISR